MVEGYESNYLLESPDTISAGPRLVLSILRIDVTIAGNAVIMPGIVREWVVATEAEDLAGAIKHLVFSFSHYVIFIILNLL